MKNFFTYKRCVCGSLLENERSDGEFWKEIKFAFKAWEEGRRQGISLWKKEWG